MGAFLDCSEASESTNVHDTTDTGQCAWLHDSLINRPKEALNKLVCCVVRQAHHELNQSLAVRPKA